LIVCISFYLLLVLVLLPLLVLPLLLGGAGNGQSGERAL